MMNLNSIQKPSPNCDRREIAVEFLVLHYTAIDLQGSLDIFLNEECSVSAHLLIDLDGSVYELVDCLEGTAFRAWHAGISHWQGHETFNNHAIGIELVNFNGNVFPYTDAQYEALAKVVAQLKSHYPSLQNPEQIVGHEHIAGFRGKADPGHCFDWLRFFSDSYPGQPVPERNAVCPAALQQQLAQLKALEPEGEKDKSRFWQGVSGLTETSIKLLQEATGTTRD